MKTYQGLILSAVIGSMLASSALAGYVIGTEKARGHFGGGGWTQLHEGRQHVDRGHRMLRHYATTPIAVTTAAAPAPIAKAPALVQTPAAVPQAAPASAPTASVSAPSMEHSAMVRSPDAHYVHHHARHADKWALPKTDPHKFDSH